MARDFAGATGDYLNCGDPASVDFGAGDFAFACWVQSDTPSATTVQCLVYKDVSGGRQFGMALTDGVGSPAVLILWD